MVDNPEPLVSDVQCRGFWTDCRCRACTHERALQVNPESLASRIADRIDSAVILNPTQKARVVAILREELSTPENTAGPV